MRHTAICLLLVAVLAGAQSLPFPGPGMPAATSFPTIALGVHAAHDNGASSSTAAAVAIGTPTAGSTIYCDVKYPVSSIGSTSVADNVNPGVYEYAVAPLRDGSHTFSYGSYYKENVAASATTVTLTYGIAGANAQIACKELKGVPTSYALDSSVLQSQAGSGTNPANPNSYTPFANNSIVLSGLFAGTGAVTAGTNFALLDNTSTLDPEYWIQTTKTATAGPFSDASTTFYAIGMAAFGNNTGGTCNATMVFPWDGGSNGATPTPATLQNSTHGGQAQPNADKLSHPPGWTLGGAAANITYSTSAYAPLSTTRNCPFYSGSGTGTLGLDHDTVAVGGNIQYHFATNQSKVTWGACISTTTPINHAGTFDVIDLSGGNNTGNADYVLLQWNSNGTLADWGLEAKGGVQAHSVATWTPNTWYWVRLEYNQASIHKAYIYTFSGAQCSGTPTLIDTLTASGSTAGGGPADYFGFFAGGSMTYASGTHWYIGASVGDILYGGAVMP